MSLRGFHVVFITASTLLSGFFANWCVREYQQAGGTGLLAAGVVSGVGSVALAAYGVWFVRKLVRAA